MQRAWSYEWEVVTPCPFVLAGLSMEKKHLIVSVDRNSIAEELQIEKGDFLLSINGNEIEDIFDYRFLIQDDYLEVLIQKSDGQEWLLEIDKDFDEDLGLEFESGLMDEYRRCQNNCIFCFIDQMPKGMRDTLYFKDDDSRLSFLQGNYVTLTNMSEHDIDRIIRYRLSPINISFQTTDPKLRCMMTGNRFAGEALKKADKLFEAGITMNGQIVLCKGINDGDNLRRSLGDLLKYVPVLQSVSVVPVGLTRYRDGLYPLEAFNKEDAREVISIIEEYQKKSLAISDYHFVHASDEFYLLAEMPLPDEDTYDGYLQLENGVGMLTLLNAEFRECIDDLKDDISSGKINPYDYSNEVSIVTGYLAYPFIKKMTEELTSLIPGISAVVYPIRNDFFGEQITVAGLVTGQDIVAQIKGRIHGKSLLIPECMLRADEPIFLDDMTVSDLENALQVNAYIVKSNGQSLVENILGE